MGTRSITTFIDLNNGKKTKLVTMYRQYDGYPEGMGLDLAEFLVKGKIVNGISLAETSLVFNGIGCLAAQVVANEKKGPGGIYLHRGGTVNIGEEYRYEIIVNDRDDIIFRCYKVGKHKAMFSGSPAEFIKKYKEEPVK